MKRRWKVMMVAPVAGLLLAGCSSESDEKTPPRPDSKPVEVADSGWVQVWEDTDWILKRCDGTTLMYRSTSYGSLAAIPNSPECTKPATSSSTAPAP